MNTPPPDLPVSRSPVLETPPALASDGRSLPARWTVVGALAAAIAGVAWVLLAQPPAQGVYRAIYWMHDHLGLQVYAKLWRTAQPFSLIWLLPMGVSAGLGLMGWLTNRSLLRAIQRRALIRAVHARKLRRPLFASLSWLQAGRCRELFATKVLNHLAERKAQALRSAVTRGSGVDRHDPAATLALAVAVTRLSGRARDGSSSKGPRSSERLILLGRAALCVHAHHLQSPKRRNEAQLAGEVEQVADMIEPQSFHWPYSVAPGQAVRAALLDPLRHPDAGRCADGQQQIETLARDVSRAIRRWTRGLEASLRGYRSQRPGEQPDRSGALMLAAALLAVSAHARGRLAELQALSDDILQLEADWRAGLLARGDVSVGEDAVGDLGRAFRCLELDVLLRFAGGVAEVQPVDGQRLSASVPTLLLTQQTFEAAPRAEGDSKP